MTIICFLQTGVVIHTDIVRIREEWDELRATDRKGNDISLSDAVKIEVIP